MCSPPSWARSLGPENPLGGPVAVIYCQSRVGCFMSSSPSFLSTNVTVTVPASWATELFHIKHLYGTQRTVTLSKHQLLCLRLK